MDKHRECITEGHCRPRHRSRKDRSRWCKGRVGVEHSYQWMEEDSLPNAHGWVAWYRQFAWCIREVQVCTACSRVGTGRRGRCRHCDNITEQAIWGDAPCPTCGAVHAPRKRLEVFHRT